MRRTLEASLKAVDERLADQQPRSEVDRVLSAVEAALVGRTGTTTLSPAAPFGMLPVEQRTDARTGREYTQLVEGPYRMTEPPPGSERYFDPAGFPKWRGRGMSLSLWLRKTADCRSAACGTYLLSAHSLGPHSSARCYSAWVEKRGGTPHCARAGGVCERRRR